MLSAEPEIKGEAYTILSTAMESKTVIVNETGSVNELSIDNNGPNYIFIHSGDIVKGGKQDRTIAYDVIVPPYTKNQALASFCVEEGRWQQRENETVSSFGSNTKMVSSRDLKLAAKYEKDQGKVWNKVAEQKRYLNDKLSKKNGHVVEVANSVSNTSLQLTLESKALEKEKKAFHSVLSEAIHTPNAVGYAYAINGEIHGVERYNNNALFTALWEKLLESIIVEAIGKIGEEVKSDPTSTDILAYMEMTKKTSEQSVKKINKATSFKTIAHEKKGNLLFVTEDMNQKKWIHRSYMRTDIIPVTKKENTLYGNPR